jgi:hypothetical protein
MRPHEIVILSCLSIFVVICVTAIQSWKMVCARLSGMIDGVFEVMNQDTKQKVEDKRLADEYRNLLRAIQVRGKVYRRNPIACTFTHPASCKSIETTNDGQLVFAFHDLNIKEAMESDGIVVSIHGHPLIGRYYGSGRVWMNGGDTLKLRWVLSQDEILKRSDFPVDAVNLKPTVPLEFEDF